MSPEPSGSPWLLVAAQAQGRTRGLAALTLYSLASPNNPRVIAEHTFSGRPLCAIVHPHQPIAYLADGDGRVVATLLTSGEVTAQPSGGETPCHLALAPDARHLLTANYTTGTVSVRRLDAGGNLGRLTQVLPLGGRSHPHHIEFNDNTRSLVITDLGADLLRSYRFDDRRGHLVELARSPTHAEPGSGPRSLCHDVHGDLWCTNEFHSSVTRYSYCAGTATPVALQTWPSTRLAGAGVTNFTGAITSSFDGRFVYVANRGLDTISVFATDPKNAAQVAEVESGGRWPVDLVVHENWLFVANRDSNDVTCFRLDEHDGVPHTCETTIQALKPGSLQIGSHAL